MRLWRDDSLKFVSATVRERIDKAAPTLADKVLTLAAYYERERQEAEAAEAAEKAAQIQREAAQKAAQEDRERQEAAQKAAQAEEDRKKAEAEAAAQKAAQAEAQRKEAEHKAAQQERGRKELQADSVEEVFRLFASKYLQPHPYAYAMSRPMLQGLASTPNAVSTRVSHPQPFPALGVSPSAQHQGLPGSMNSRPKLVNGPQQQVRPVMFGTPSSLPPTAPGQILPAHYCNPYLGYLNPQQLGQHFMAGKQGPYQAHGGANPGPAQSGGHAVTTRPQVQANGQGLQGPGSNSRQPSMHPGAGLLLRPSLGAEREQLGAAAARCKLGGEDNGSAERIRKHDELENATHKQVIAPVWTQEF